MRRAKLMGGEMIVHQWLSAARRQIGRREGSKVGVRGKTLKS